MNKLNALKHETMKNFLITTIIFATSTLLLIACTKSEENPENLPQEGQKASITLSLVGTELATRSTGTIPNQTADNSINKIMVFIFNTSNGEIDRMKVATPSEITNKSVSITGTSGTRDIYVVVNYPTADSTALANVATVTDLKAVTADLKNENEANFRMIGKKVNQTINAGSNTIAIIVSRLVARIALTNITTNFSGGLAGKSLAIDSIYLLNVIGSKSYQDSSFFVSSPTIYNRTAPGLAFPIFDAYGTPASVNNTTAYNTISGYANGNHYYVYANNGTTFTTSTKLIITGMLNGIRTYYPIAINVSGNGYTPGTAGITANSQYSITANITGFGSTTPTTPVISANLTITVTPQNWATIINQNVSF